MTGTDKLSEDGEIRITNRDMLSGNYREEWYHVDTNLDGIADDRDGFGGMYDFYILCSGNSYSCGNALPYFAGQEGLAAVLGTRPGGGDCMAARFVDAYGRCASYSGMLKLGAEEDGAFVSNEKAVVPDFEMMPSVLDIWNAPWYDAEGIADAVHRYQNGDAVMTYDDVMEKENFSDYLNMLLERIGQDLEEAG